MCGRERYWNVVTADDSGKFAWSGDLQFNDSTLTALCHLASCAAVTGTNYSTCRTSECYFAKTQCAISQYNKACSMCGTSYNNGASTCCTEVMRSFFWWASTLLATFRRVWQTGCVARYKAEVDSFYDTGKQIWELPNSSEWNTWSTLWLWQAHCFLAGAKRKICQHIYSSRKDIMRYCCPCPIVRSSSLRRANWNISLYHEQIFWWSSPMFGKQPNPSSRYRCWALSEAGRWANEFTRSAHGMWRSHSGDSK